jgi:hypothetical protein
VDDMGDKDHVIVVPLPLTANRVDRSYYDLISNLERLFESSPELWERVLFVTTMKNYRLRGAIISIPFVILIVFRLLYKVHSSLISLPTLCNAEDGGLK